MDGNSFIVYIKTGDIYKEDVETRFATSNYELNRTLSKEKKKKVIGLMNAELGGQIVIEFFVLKVKRHSYLTDDGRTKQNAQKVYGKKKKLKIIKTI